MSAAKEKERDSVLNEAAEVFLAEAIRLEVIRRTDGFVGKVVSDDTMTTLKEHVFLAMQTMTGRALVCSATDLARDRIERAVIELQTEFPPKGKKKR